MVNTTKGGSFHTDGDTIKTELITKPISGIVDSTLIRKLEPTLKAFSKTLGKALQEYGESSEQLETSKKEK